MNSTLGQGKLGGGGDFQKGFFYMGLGKRGVAASQNSTAPSCNNRGLEHDFKGS